MDADTELLALLFTEGLIDRTTGRLAQAELAQLRTQGRPIRAIDLLAHRGWVSREAVAEAVRRRQRETMPMAPPERRHSGPQAVAGGDAATLAMVGAPRPTSQRAPQAASEPERIAEFEIERELGRGGMGIVWLAWDGRLRRRVAIKQILSADKELVERFHREARLAARLAEHPGIARILELRIEGEGAPFIVMEYIAGRPLDELVKADPIGGRRAAEILAELCEIVSFAHGEGVVHRDLKPANVLVKEDGSVVVLDFGIAKDLDAETALTATLQTMGTPGYMAPEQIDDSREAREEADIYGLGAILYFALTGQPPFVGTPSSLLYAVLYTDPVPPRELNERVPRDLEVLCLRCLEKEPGRRFSEVESLGLELERFLEGEAILSRPDGLLVRWSRRAWRRKGASLAALLLVVLGVALPVSWGVFQSQSSKTQAYALGLELLPALDQILSFRNSAPLVDEEKDEELITRTRRQSEEILERLDEELAREPVAALYTLKGRVYLRLSRSVEALECVGRALKLEPKSAAAWLFKGRCLIDRLILDSTRFAAAKGRQSLAQQAVRAFAQARALGLKPDGLAEAWEALVGARLGRCRELLETLEGRVKEEDLRILELVLLIKESPGARHEEKVQVLNRALERCPRHFQALLMRGVQLMDLKRFDEALADLNQAAKLHEDPEVYESQGFCYYQLGRFPEAVAASRIATRIAPKRPHSYSLRGMVLKREGHYREAIAEFSEGLAKGGPDRVMYYNRGNAFNNLREWSQALRDLDKAIAMADSEAECFLYYNRAQAHAGLGQEIKALSDYDEALLRDEEVKTFPQGYFLRAQLRATLGRTEAALEDYNRSIRFAPKIVAAYAMRCELAKQAGRFRQAFRDYDAAIRKGYKSSASLVARGYLHEGLGRLPEAKADYIAALRLDQSNAEAWNHIGGLQMRLGDIPAALSCLNKALSLKPDSVRALTNRGQILASRGDLAGGVRDVERALSLDPKSASAYAARGILYHQSGNPSAAARSFKKSLALAPDQAQAQTMRDYVAKNLGE